MAIGSRFFSGRKDDHRVLLLGAGAQQEEDLRKRVDIKHELIRLGYSSTKLGEEVVGAYPGGKELLPLVLVEDLLFSDFDTILVIDNGPAPLAELARFSTKSWFLRKAAVLVPIEFHSQIYGRRTYPASIVGMYRTLAFYNKEEIASCDLLRYCVQIVEADWYVKTQEDGGFDFLGWPRS